jgi:hypothetical protein
MSILETIPVRDGLALALVPAKRSLLDVSGNGHKMIVASGDPKWIRTKGIESVVCHGASRFSVADAPGLQHTTRSIFMGGDFGQYDSSTHRFVSKRDSGQTEFEFFAPASGQLQLAAAVGTSLANVDWEGSRSIGFSHVSGDVARFSVNGAPFVDGGTTATITSNTADIIVGNIFVGNSPMQFPFHALLDYSRDLSAEEFALLHAWSESLKSPSLPADRRYFDMGSLVPHGPQTQAPEQDSATVIADGDMEAAGTASWFNIGTGGITKETGDPHGGTQVIRSTNHATVPAGNIFKTNSPLVVGKRYRARGWVRSNGDTVPRLYNAGVGYFWIGSLATTWQAIDVVFIATNATLNFYNVGTTVSAYTEWDDLSIVETDEQLSDGYMEASGVGEWTAINSAALTKETGTPFEGSQVLRVGWGATTYGSARQSILTAGRKYRITGRARGDGVNSPRVYCNTLALKLWQGTSSVAWQAFDVEFTPTSADLDFYANMVSGYIEFDSVSVKPVRETLASWDFRDITGRTVPDRSGNGLDGALTGDCGPAQSVIGRGVNFGGNGYVTASNPTLGDEGAVELWHIPQNIAGSEYLAACGDGTRRFAFVRVTNDLRFSYYDGSTVLSASVNNVFEAGVPIHLVATWADSGNTITLYANGQTLTQAATAASTQGTAALVVGARNDGTSPSTGVIAFFVLLSYALTAEEVGRHWAPLARNVVYDQDLSMVAPTLADVGVGQTIPGTDYEVTAGTFSVVEEDGLDLIQATGATSFYARRQPFAKGTWHFGFRSQGDPSTRRIYLMSDNPSGAPAVGGYAITIFGTSLGIALQKFVPGASSVWTTAGAYISHDVYYEFWVSRDDNGLWTTWIRGGAFAVWTLVSTAGGSGSNPDTEATINVSTYRVGDLDGSGGLEDQVGIDRQYHGPFPPI